MTTDRPSTDQSATPAIAATLDTTFKTILDGNAALLDAVARESLTALAHELHTARRVFVTGAGRSGLIMQLFAIRLGHLDIDVTIMGLPIVPPVGPGDLFLAASGSGATEVTVQRVRKAKALGARIGAFTAQADGELAALADVCVLLPVPAKNSGHALAATQLYDGAFFEQGTFLITEALFHELALFRGAGAGELWARHANVE